jgi:hypothetical protein
MSIDPGIGMPLPQPGAVPGSTVYRPVPAQVSNWITSVREKAGVSQEEYDAQFNKVRGASSQSYVYGYNGKGEIVTQDPSLIKNQFPLFTKNWQQYILAAMKNIGIRPTQASIETFLGNVLDFSATKNELTGSQTLWLDSIDEFVNAYGSATAARGGGRGGPTQAVNLTDPGTAKQLMNQSLQQYLGRDATPDELEKFVTALNKAEMRNPQTSVRSGSTAVSAGGFNPATFAQDYAAGMEGAGEFQAVTSALDNFIGSLSNPVKVL